MRITKAWVWGDGNGNLKSLFRPVKSYDTFFKSLKVTLCSYNLHCRSFSFSYFDIIPLAEIVLNIPTLGSYKTLKRPHFSGTWDSRNEWKKNSPLNTPAFNFHCLKYCFLKFESDWIFICKTDDIYFQTTTQSFPKPFFASQNLQTTVQSHPVLQLHLAASQTTADHDRSVVLYCYTDAKCRPHGKISFRAEREESLLFLEWTPTDIAVLKIKRYGTGWLKGTIRMEAPGNWLLCLFEVQLIKVIIPIPLIQDIAKTSSL